MRQFDLGRLDWPDFHFPLFEASMAFVEGADKKGDSPAASKRPVSYLPAAAVLDWVVTQMVTVWNQYRYQFYSASTVGVFHLEGSKSSSRS